MSFLDNILEMVIILIQGIISSAQTMINFLMKMVGSGINFGSNGIVYAIVAIAILGIVSYFLFKFFVGSAKTLLILFAIGAIIIIVFFLSG